MNIYRACLSGVARTVFVVSTSYELNTSKFQPVRDDFCEFSSESLDEKSLPAGVRFNLRDDDPEIGFSFRESRNGNQYSLEH